MRPADRPRPNGVSDERWRQMIERDEAMIRMRREGLTNAEIAKALDLGRTTVSDRFNDLRKMGVDVPEGLQRGEATRRFYRPLTDGLPQRRCLYCGQMRPSAGPHDRLHAECRHKAAAGVPYWSGQYTA